MFWFYECIIVFTMLLSMFVPKVLATTTCANNVATNFEWPLDGWVTNCNNYWSSCNRDYHLGSDSAPGGDVIGTPVHAPCTGVIKESQFHNGYGGTVILECYTGSECVTVLIGHMFPETYTYSGVTYTGLQVSAGSNVSTGDLIGYIADRDDHRNGGYAPHTHIGIHKGSYSSTPTYACDGNWSYAGYTFNTCVADDWYPPDNFISSHQLNCPSYLSKFTAVKNAYGNFIGNATGAPPPYGSGSFICTRNYDNSGSSWGTSAILFDSGGGARRAYLVRSGFWVTWTNRGGPLSSLGMPITQSHLWQTCTVATAVDKNGIDM